VSVAVRRATGDSGAEAIVVVEYVVGWNIREREREGEGEREWAIGSGSSSSRRTIGSDDEIDTLQYSSSFWAVCVCVCASVGFPGGFFAVRRGPNPCWQAGGRASKQAGSPTSRQAGQAEARCVVVVLCVRVGLPDNSTPLSVCLPRVPIHV
jgi:hypothetical protein